jgi:O-6-methylguanine DNA methyltransferase
LRGGQAGGPMRQTAPMSVVAVAFATLAGPFGPYHLAATERGVVAAEWGVSDDAFRQRLAVRLGATLEASDAAQAVLDAAIASVERIIAGEPVGTSEVVLDLTDRPVFDRRVLLAVRDVPWGGTASYGEIARRVGAPRAARAVGGAVGRNPVALLVPCHRIIAADGTLGGYGGDGPADRAEALDRKRALLRREGVTVSPRAG